MTSLRGKARAHGSRRRSNALLVVAKCAELRFRRSGENCARSLAPPLPTTTTAQPLAALPPYGCGVPLADTTLGRGWVPGGSAPYDFRTQGARLENGLNLFGAGMNLGPLRPPPAAAHIYQLHVSPLFPLAPLVCLAFPAPLGSFLAPCMARWGIGPYMVRLTGVDVFLWGRSPRKPKCNPA